MDRQLGGGVPFPGVSRKEPECSQENLLQLLQVVAEELEDKLNDIITLSNFVSENDLPQVMIEQLWQNYRWVPSRDPFETVEEVAEDA